MSAVTIRRIKEGGEGRNAHARPGKCAVANLGEAPVFAFDLQREGLGPVVVFDLRVHEATMGGTPIETIDEGTLSATPLFPGHPVEIHLRGGHEPGRNGATSLVVQAVM